LYSQVPSFPSLFNLWLGLNSTMEPLFNKIPFFFWNLNLIFFFFFDSIFSVFLIRGSWFVYSRNIFINIWMNFEYWCFITLLFMRWPIDLYIVEFYIIDILFLSFFHPFIYLYILIALQLIIWFFFISVAIIISPHRSLFWFSILGGSLYPDNGKRWVGYLFFSN